MDRTVDGDVQQDKYTERDVDAATPDLTVDHRHPAAVGPQAGEPLRPESSIDQVVVGDIPRQPPGFRQRPYLVALLSRPGHGVSVLTGQQGVGKTQLAAAYAREKLAGGWRLVAWVNGADTSSLLSGLAAVADATGLTDDDSGPEVADAGAAVRHWLETDGDRCLLVFDDVSDPEVLQPFVPARGTARVLITTARQSAANLGSVQVDMFSAEEASAFLEARTRLDDEAGAAAVAHGLGHLPLALALTGPVIAERRLGYGWYLDRLDAMSADVSLTEDGEQASTSDMVAATLLSLQAVRAADQTGVCTRVMEMVAILSAAGVRRELLHVAGQAGVLGGGRRVTRALVDRAVEWLSGRSLLTLSLDGQSVIMHRLVAQVVRDGLARRQRLTAMCLTATYVLDAYARALVGSDDRPAVRGIPQHVTALQGNMAETSTVPNEDLARVLLRLRFIALYHLTELRDSALQAVAIGEPLTADLEHLLGPDHPDTLNSRNSLAAAYLAAGRAAEAIPLFEETLAVRQRLLGPDHPDTLTSQNNLAAAYQDAGQAPEAIQLYEQALATRERLLGPEHPSTLDSRGNLATAYRDTGRANEAIQLFEQTLADRERVLGPDHPDTQTSRRNLAVAYRDAGRATEAGPLFERTLTSRKKLATDYRDGTLVAEVILPVEQNLTVRGSQQSADAAEQVLADFRRPPADSARRVLPVGFRRPPADPASQALHDSVARRSAELTGHSSASRSQFLPPKDVGYDSEIVAAIAAGDPSGIAMAYDRYAAAVYGYCHWMLHDLADAAEALQKTFIIAAATLSDLSKASELRPRLYAVARSQCRRRIRPVSAARDENADAANQLADVRGRAAVVGQSADATHAPPDVTMPFRVVRESAAEVREPPDVTMPFRVVRESAGMARESTDATMAFRVIGQTTDMTMPFRMISQPIGATDGVAQVNGDLGQAELRALIRSILAELKPREREVVELSFRHDLDDNDLAIALGVSVKRAHVLASRARARLEEAVNALHIAFTRRGSCSVLAELLSDWDGQLTEQTRDLVSWHIEECPTCANQGRSALRSAVFSRVLPLAPLPPELREQVLIRCSSTAEDVVAYRRRVVRRAESMWLARLSQAIRWVSWDSIRAHPGAAIAATAVAVWAVAAVSVTLLTFGGSHAAQAQVVQPSVRTSSSSPAARTAAAAPRTTAAARKSAAAKPSPTVSQPAYVPSPAPASPSPSPSHSPRPSKSPSPTPSRTTSSPSHTASPSPSSSPSPSATA